MNEYSLRGEILHNEMLSNYTTWRVGGIAKRMYKPADLADLANFLKTLPKDESIIWLGLGSNSLIKDSGFSGTIILTQGALNNISITADGLVEVEAGVSCAQMARFCARNCLIGAEFWAGIPGTMGGALRMNAGCFNGETWEFVEEVKTINRSGVIKIRTKAEFEVSYRSVVGLAEDEWFVAASCRLQPGDKQQSLDTIKELLAHRANTQPTSEYNCGSVFRNPPNSYAAKLIDGCNLKGYKLGGAMVSEKHANFIINHNGTASAKNIEDLINEVQQKVYEKTAIKLIREIHIIGDK
ncbi:MAG: UDP-N-acetylenolpyruvoylglucosamine reductase [Legionellales bacterium RIFCSPHIGHO2_12_FULL_35_11]|nr:MAG: UDP-N-acetylenolpyruvoylglucosamine reductase [Legionellales bacterium RIFCSPHIGHO2_12_FULL_35_11]